MEASAAVAERHEDEQVEQVEQEEIVAAAETLTDDPEQIFKWSSWVHVGPGAEDCEHIERSEDDSPTKVACPHESPDTPLAQRHFHAWLRLPNQFAYRDISEKAQAARARKQRQLRDPESDQHIIMEDALDDLRDEREAMVQEIVASKYDDIEEAQRRVDEDEEFKHIIEDQVERRRLEAVPEEQRDADAYESLKRHTDAYQEKIEKTLESIRKRREESLEGLDTDELVGQVRKLRIERLGVGEYLHVSNYWVWYVGTMTPVAGSSERKFPNIQALTQASPEIISALQEEFSILERNLSPMGRAKNS